MFYHSLINLLLHLQADEWVQGKRGDGADRKGMTVVASLYATARGGKERTQSPNTQAHSLEHTHAYVKLWTNIRSGKKQSTV